MSGKAAFQAATNVSRETFEMLEAYEKLLLAWNPKINLVAPSTLDELWVRHFLDSAQLVEIASVVDAWVDLGSGGGFPGAIVAILTGGKTVLIESDQRKAAFLRTVARETCGFKVISKRIEDVPPQNADVVSARALAPLSVLLGYVQPHLKDGGSAVLLKGKKAKDEIREALEHWRFDCETYPSKTDPEAVVLKIGDIQSA